MQNLWETNCADVEEAGVGRRFNYGTHAEYLITMQLQSMGIQCLSIYLCMVDTHSCTVAECMRCVMLLEFLLYAMNFNSIIIIMYPVYCMPRLSVVCLCGIQSNGYYRYMCSRIRDGDRGWPLEDNATTHGNSPINWVSAEWSWFIGRDRCKQTVLNGSRSFYRQLILVLIIYCQNIISLF